MVQIQTCFMRRWPSFFITGEQQKMAPKFQRWLILLSCRLETFGFIKHKSSHIYILLVRLLTRHQFKYLESHHIMSGIRDRTDKNRQDTKRQRPDVKQKVRTDLKSRGTRLKRIKVWVENAVKSICDFLLPVVHYVRDDGGKEAEQHDGRAGIHHRVQKLPRVGGEWQHLLQILRCQKRNKIRY